MERYDLKYKGRTVGFAEVGRAGRYYCVCARYRVPEKTPLRLFVACGNRQFDLGLCVQYQDEFGTERRVPMERIGEGALEFYLQNIDQFVPVSESQPFAYLDKVMNGRFALRNNTMGIILRENRY